MNRPMIRNRKYVRQASVAISVWFLLTSGADLRAAQAPHGAMSTSDVLDLYEQHKDEYVTPKTPTFVEVGEAHYLAITGKGAPGSPTFGQKIGTMYQVAFALKMRNKSAGRDYHVAPLEGLWWGSKNKHNFMAEPRETWNWKLLIRVPEFITSKDVTETTDALGGRGRDAAVKEVRLETLTEGRCLQVLYVGPYDQEADTVSAMRDFAENKGLTLNGPHHEIYLSDPSRTEPAKLRTILRQPVKAAAQ